MPKAWPMLASALNPQLGWGAQWKGVVADLACILVLHLLLETTLGRVGMMVEMHGSTLGSFLAFLLPPSFGVEGGSCRDSNRYTRCASENWRGRNYRWCAQYSQGDAQCS